MKLFNTPKLASVIFPKRVWFLKEEANTIYLTFDDGPRPEITPFILDILKEKKIKATFFCVGINVEKFPDIFLRIIKEGHRVGNHTFLHENHSKTDFKAYKKSIDKAETLIYSNLFRPPYGRLTSIAARKIAKKYKIIMWSWLSYDFDKSISIDYILKKADKEIKSGDIIVLHDNEKIADRQKELLPKLLEILNEKKFKFEVIPN
jgi:peptidoglycan/xylan/chitin deacetylase (PgdA/CDA1 family)